MASDNRLSSFCFFSLLNAVISFHFSRYCNESDGGVFVGGGVLGPTYSNQYVAGVMVGCKLEKLSFIPCLDDCLSPFS